MLSRAAMKQLLEQVFAECAELLEAGQREYAHGEDNALAHFERQAQQLGLSREQVLMVYLGKHIDGIAAWVGGHRSQREDISGRINDAIVYLCLLRGMVEEERERMLREMDHVELAAADQVVHRDGHVMTIAEAIEEAIRDGRMERPEPGRIMSVPPGVIPSRAFGARGRESAAGS